MTNTPHTQSQENLEESQNTIQIITNTINDFKGSITQEQKEKYREYFIARFTTNGIHDFVGIQDFDTKRLKFANSLNIWEFDGYDLRYLDMLSPLIVKNMHEPNPVLRGIDRFGKALYDTMQK